jgi:oxygen-independent coproporphyrinogen-3 oxidase
MLSTSTLGVYVQIPFCSSKCSFCNFSSRVAPSSAFDAYCRTVLDEIGRLPAAFEQAGLAVSNSTGGLLDRRVDTVYFGGGTPSLLGSDRLQRIVKALEERFRFEDVVEFTIEIAPGSADSEFLMAVRALGINRLSIGAQSFDDGELRCVGRLHSAKDISKLVEAARRAGFTNISLDLIAGLPYQTELSWQHSLSETASLRPEHVSVYLFELDEKSRLGREALGEGTRYHANAIPTEEFVADAYESARSFLAGEGYVQYEISNFAHAGYQSRHNRKYWQMAPYVGIGAGAHSFSGTHRWANATSVEEYQARIAGGQPPIAELHALSCEEQLEEFFFLGLRQESGVDLNLASQQWGQGELSRWEGKISALSEQGWIERQGQRIRIPARAYLVSNEIFQEFLN